MNKTENVKQAMHEMFGVGKGTEKTAPAPRSGREAHGAEAPVPPAVSKKVPELPVSLLAEGTSFEGTLKAKGSVEIRGEFKGSITAKGTVRLHSNIQSGVNAGNVELLDCMLTGDIVAGGTVTVSEKSRIIGNVTAGELLCAGEISGDLKVTDSVRLDARARVSGSIVTGAISVEKGASISGNVQIRTLTEAGN